MAPPRTALALFALASVSWASAVSRAVEDRALLDAASVCALIASSVSSASDVYFLGQPQYTADNAHWASSSSQNSACSVEPGTAADVGVILQILGENQQPFGVKGGGHASNPGYSSTSGVQISMTRFSNVDYDASSSTATIGMGLIWDDVYAALAPFNVNVVGGRVTGVGVAGFSLGGGYSWKSNQFGLTVDTITAFELVLPNGTVTTVTESSNPDLMFALRGGSNNYGIVTQFTLQTFPQGQVWGGLITYTVDQMQAVANATQIFAEQNTDPKAAIITTMNAISGLIVGLPGISQLIFYDGPTPPVGLFDNFLAIPHFSEDISTRSFISLVQSSPSNATAGLRGVFNTVSVTDYTEEFLNVVINETKFWGNVLSPQSAFFVSYDLEPFLPSATSHGTTSSAAFPPNRSKLFPTNLYYAWTLEAADEVMQNAIRQSAATLQAAATSEGQDIEDLPLYGNYAIFGTPLESIYGNNLARMRQIKSEVDPNNVMGLTGGWKL